MSVNKGRDFANIYVAETLENVERTVMTLYYEEDGVRYRHYVFVLAGNKTRMTVEKLGAGKYICEATQFAGETSISATLTFTIDEFVGVDTGMDLSDVVAAIKSLKN